MRHLLDWSRFPTLQAYFEPLRPGRGIDLRGVPPELLAAALALVVDCVTCGREIHPIRERDLSVYDRRISRVGPHYYSGTCPSTVSGRCSKGSAASADIARMRAVLEGRPVDEPPRGLFEGAPVRGRRR